MTPKGFFALTAVTAALIVGAIVAYPKSTTSNPEPGPRFFPSLGPEAVNKVTSIKVMAKGKTFVIERKGKGWFVKDKGDYPARFDKVKEALVSIANLRRFEKKTNKKDLLGKLDLEDPAKKGASSKRLTIATGGKTVADLIVGKSNDKDILFGRSLVYVRLPNSTQAWLAIGDPKLEDSPLGWIDKTLFDIKTDRIKKVVQKPVKGSEIVVEQLKPAGKKFKLDNLPDGREIKNARYMRYVSEGLNDVKLEDVQPASKVDFTKHAAGTAVFTTFDGLVVTVKLATVGPKKDEKTWATFHASVDPAALLKKAPAKGSKLMAADAVKKEAATINAKVKGWAFQLNSTVSRFMTYKMVDMLKPAKKAAKKPPEDKKKAAAPKPAPAPKTTPATKTDTTPAPKKTEMTPAKKTDAPKKTEAPKKSEMTPAKKTDTPPATKPEDKPAAPK